MNPKISSHAELADLLSVIAATVDEYSPQLPLAMRRLVGDKLRHARGELAQGRGLFAVAEAQDIAEKTRMPAACLLRAVTLLAMNQHQSALAALFDLEQLHPGLAEGYLMQGLILHALDRRAEARSVLQRAVQRKPGLMTGWKLLIKMTLEKEHRNAAFLVFQEALRYSARYPELLSLQSCLRQKPPFASTAGLMNGPENSPPTGEPMERPRYAAMVSIPS